MSDQRALLAAICAHPEEDTPRLAYADWLDEHAGAMPRDKRESVRMRAELIRVQCELARLPPEEEDSEMAARRIELEDRQAELTKNASRRRTWAKPLRPPGESGSAILPENHRFVRGFPHFVSGNAADLLAIGEEVFNISPLHVLACRNLSGELGERFLAQPWLSRVRRLGTSTNIDLSRWVEGPPRYWLNSSGGTDVASTEKLFAAPLLANLEELELRNWEFGALGTPVANRALTNLRKLDLLGGAGHASAAFGRLGELLPMTTRIRGFNLTSTRLGAEELAAVAALPQFSQLERLSLGLRYGVSYSVPPPGITGMQAITTAPFWRSLRSFRDDMGHSGLTAAEAEELAAAPPAPNLRSLYLSSGNLGQGVAALAASPVLASVTSLLVTGTRFGDEGAIALAKSPHLGRLVHLNIGWSGVGPKGMKAIAEAPWAANLVRLSIAGCPIRKDGISALIAPGHFPKLKRLDVGDAAKNTAQKNRLRARYGDAVRF